MSELNKIKAKARRASRNRILDMIFPRGGNTPYSQWRTIRRKLRKQLQEGRLDERRLEVEIIEHLQDIPDSFDFDSIVHDVLQNQLPKDNNAPITDDLIQAVRTEIEVSLGFRNVRRQVMTVKETLEYLIEEEYARLKATTVEVEQDTSLSPPTGSIIIVQDSLLRLMASNPELMYRITHRQFEELVFEIFGKLGYAVELTARTRDGGCDLIAFRDDTIGIRTKYVIEAKHYKPENKVGVSIVRQLSAVRQKFGAHHGVLVTSSFFTKDAVEENRAFYGLHLNDYDGVLGWIKKS